MIDVPRLAKDFDGADIPTSIDPDLPDCLSFGPDELGFVACDGSLSFWRPITIDDIAAATKTIEIVALHLDRETR